MEGAPAASERPERPKLIVATSARRRRPAPPEPPSPFAGLPDDLPEEARALILRREAELRRLESHGVAARIDARQQSYIEGLSLFAILGMLPGAGALSIVRVLAALGSALAVGRLWRGKGPSACVAIALPFFLALEIGFGFGGQAVSLGVLKHIFRFLAFLTLASMIGVAHESRRSGGFDG